MIAISVILAAIAAVVGHLAAVNVPAWFGYQSTTTAGMMASVAGIILFGAVCFSPQHGVFTRLARQRMLAWNILAEDVIGFLYRMRERGQKTTASIANLRQFLLADRLSMRLVLWWLTLQRQLAYAHGEYGLTDAGRARAQGLIRSHRLWEKYLTSKVGIEGEQIHAQAERLEHFTDRQLRDQLNAETDRPQLDPHGRPIPPE
jgi:manganese/zinc/iron transport system permease protein